MNAKRLLKIIIPALILASWVGTMSLLIEKEGLIIKGAEKIPDLQRFLPADIKLDVWKGIYIKSRWVGYVHTTLDQSTDMGYTLQSKSHFRFKMFDDPKTLTIHTRQLLDREYRMLSFVTNISGITPIALEGKRVGKQMIVEIVYGNTRLKKIFDGADDFFLEQGILSTYRGKNLKVGDVFTLHVLNPLTLKKERVRTEVIGKEEENLLTETRVAGLLSRAWVNGDGFVVREETPNGWEMRLESKETIDRYLARPEENMVDILRDAAIDPGRKLENPLLVKTLKLKISGIDLEEIPFDSDRQRIIDNKEGIIEITASNPVAGTEGGDEAEKYLDPSPWIDSENPAIMKKASEIAGSEKDRWTVAVKIGEWIHQNLEKAYSPEIPVASSILKNRMGDCNEHTVLFIAMARALGIPAMMSTGLVYTNDGFYYHAWPKVYMGRWVHLDPTFGQSIADATHIELASGDFSAQAKIAMTMGKIKIEILDAAY